MPWRCCTSPPSAAGCSWSGRGMLALSTALSDDLVDDTIDRYAAAFADVAAEL